MTAGCLYLLPTLLGDDAGAGTLCGWEIGLIQELSCYFVENERSARRFLRRAGFTGDLNSIELHLIDKNTSIAEQRKLVKMIESGRDVGFISEAGCPAIADPGASIVQLAHEKNLTVIPIPGPSAILLTQMGSGMNGQQFTFNGYLPIEPHKRVKAILELEITTKKTGFTQLFIETPYRNTHLLADLLKHCSPDLRICIGVNLTQPAGWIKTKNASEWKLNPPDIHKLPAVFAISF
jgi:16S rRNA (cytidine1402-2'-O)-methyltransferase